MPDLEGINIEANNIDDAAEEIVRLLKDARKGNVMYFAGWEGLGVSAALKAVAKRLKSSTAGMMDDPRLKLFDKVIHVDCSVWKSRRALQKAVAEELELPQSVMVIFERHDEDDDFNGVDQGSRGEIQQVAEEIFANLSGHRFVVIFHNGSKNYIDLSDCGIPMYPYLRNRVLWTELGRFRPSKISSDEFEEIMGSTSVILVVTPKEVIGVDDSILWDLVHVEAKEVAEYTGMPECIDHRIVEECILYMWPLQDMKGIDWETHASNFWVCDGIIQGDRSAWEIGDALQIYVHFDCNWEHMDRAIPFSTTHLHRDVPRQPPICQSSSSSKITSLPPEATSFFIEGTDEADTVIPAGLFQHPDNSKLHVLHLSFCTFSFASPPFLCCSNLRFLLLQHCKDDTNNAEANHQIHSQSGSWRTCFRKLWVLDLSYTELHWLLSEEMISTMAALRELNVKGLKHWHITDLPRSGTSLVKLRVTSGPVPAEVDDTKNHSTFPNLSSANNLKTVILDGCVGLEQISPDVLSPSLESFSFLNSAADVAKICSISFRGCSKLKSILLRGRLGSLDELDLSGTAVKTLDLRELEAPILRRLVLLGCEKLCAILWPPGDKMKESLKVLRIDNRSASSCQVYCQEKTDEATAAATGSSSILVAAATKSEISRAASFNYHISVRDARLLRSFEYLRCYSVYMEIDSSHVSRVAVGSSKVAQGTRRLQPISRSQEPAANQYLNVRDAVFQGHLQAGVISWMWDIPHTPRARDWYVHIQDQQETKSGLLQQQQTSIEGTSTSVASLPAFICDNATMLHVHDSLSITSIDFPRHSTWATWGWLEYCRVERCTKLHSVFAAPQISSVMNMFWCLQTFWASHLPMVRYIWNCRTIYQLDDCSFEQLLFLHLDYCPRLIHVLPLSKHMATLPFLETLEIVCCGDLREVFPLDPKHPGQQKTIEFPMLRRIHLHELPTLQHIGGSRMSASKLETVKIRGCWSLKRLPAISINTKPPKVDCEREWWDMLEWDGVEANHHPSLYEASHSVYYKKAQLPRGTLLR